MSGYKIAEVRLGQRYRKELEAEMKEQRRARSVLSKLVNRAARVEAQVAALQSNAEGSAPEQPARFRSALGAWGERRSALERVLAEAGSRHEVAGGFRGRVRSGLEELRKSADALAACRDEVRVAIKEAGYQAQREGAVAERARLNLVGLRAELRRLETPGLEGAGGHAAEAGALAAEMYRRIGEAARHPVRPREVESFRRRLDELVERREVRALLLAERRVVVGLIQKTFEQAGYRLRWADGRADTDEPLQFQYELEEAQVRSDVRVRIPAEGHVAFHMGAEGSAGPAAFEADRFCEQDMGRIVREARALGLQIHNVCVRDPDGGYDALPLPGETETEEHEAHRYDRRCDR